MGSGIGAEDQANPPTPPKAAWSRLRLLLCLSAALDEGGASVLVQVKHRACLTCVGGKTESSRQTASLATASQLSGTSASSFQPCGISSFSVALPLS